MEPSEIVVVAGTRYLEKSPKNKRNAKNFIFHPRYSPYHPLETDIALIQLEEPLSEDNLNVQRLEIIDDIPEDGTMCTALGWGSTYAVSI